MKLSEKKKLQQVLFPTVHIRPIHAGFVLINKKTNLPEGIKRFASRDNAIYYCGQNNLKISTTSKFARACSQCGSGMNVGFCIKGGEAYYCSEICLHKRIGKKEYLALYDNEDGDTYYGTWSVKEDGMADK